MTRSKHITRILFWQTSETKIQLLAYLITSWWWINSLHSTCFHSFSLKSLIKIKLSWTLMRMVILFVDFAPLVKLLIMSDVSLISLVKGYFLKIAYGALQITCWDKKVGAKRTIVYWWHLFSELQSGRTETILKCFASKREIKQFWGRIAIRNCSLWKLKKDRLVMKMKKKRQRKTS